MFTPTDLKNLSSDLSRRAGVIQGEIDSMSQTFGRTQWQGPSRELFTLTENGVESSLSRLVALMEQAAGHAATLAVDYQNELNELASIARGIKNWLNSEASRFEHALDFVTDLIGIPIHLLPAETSREWQSILTTARRHGYPG